MQELGTGMQVHENNAPGVNRPSIAAPWTRTPLAICTELDVDVEHGLSSVDAVSRQRHYGPNQLREYKRRTTWSILLAQFKSLIVALLGAAVIAAFLFNEILEGGAIGAVILINVTIGFVTELRAVRSMEALYSMGSVRTRIRRNGQIREIPAEDLVPGDIVIVEGGDIVTADLRIIEDSKLQADESALTGESMPVGKAVDPVEEAAPLAERSGMLFKGTSITRGAGEGVVVAIGMGTELGRISALVHETEDETTPLEKRLDQLGRRLVGVTILIAVLAALSGILGGKSVFLMIETGIALAVAAIPEGLPIVATLALARGIRLMAQRNALVTRLSSVETLGSTDVICVDKTGTLTENKMTVTELVLETGKIDVKGDGTFESASNPIDPAKDRVLQSALETGVLCNNATLTEGDDAHVGDPLEVALLIAGADAGIDQAEIGRRIPEVLEEAFDPEIKMMATVHEAGGEFLFAVKGAPEAIIPVSESVLTESGPSHMDDARRAVWLKRNEDLAAEGLRVLALATKNEDLSSAEPYQRLVLIGLVGIEDPPRRDVKAALERCRSAGISVVMATGDQPATARGVAKDVGLADDDNTDVVQGSSLNAWEALPEDETEHLRRKSIFARVSPEQKLSLIALHQKSGSIVAMTGDGVNDAPALKKADIGIAMGQRGTQVAREVSDMVLRDDAFSTIVAAVEHGRVIFGNIRRFVFYLLSCNVSEVMVVGIAALVRAPLPILPLQILFLNLVTDVFPALALGMGRNEAGVMNHPPRDSKEPILAKRHWMHISLYAVTITVSVLGAFALALLWLDLEGVEAVTISFLTLALAQLWHVFNMRSVSSSFARNEITQNPYVWSALVLCLALIGAAVYVPGLSDVLSLSRPGANELILILGMSLVPLVVGQLYIQYQTKKAVG